MKKTYRVTIQVDEEKQNADQDSGVTSSLKPLTLYLTSQQSTDLVYALEGTVYQKQEQLDDIGKDYPFSDPAERDDIRNNLKRELDILEHVLSLLAGPPTRGEGPTSED